MLRRKVSAGLLRASAQASASSPSVTVAKPPGNQTANLASAVLLSSSRNWREETVTTLKTELKRRGLSQQGKKADLVTRLASNDVSAALPPPPPLSLRKAMSTPILRPRNISTTAPRSFPPKTPAPAAAPDAAEHVTSTGPAVSSQKTEAPKAEKVAPEAVTVAPGLPQTKDAGKNVGETLDVKMPKPRPHAPVKQVIVGPAPPFPAPAPSPRSSPSSRGASNQADEKPLEPDTFRSAKSQTAPKAKEEPLPKVTTVASAATHHAGGPTHAVHEHADAHTIETAESEASEAAQALAKSIPSLSDALASAIIAPVRAWNNMGLSADSIPTIGRPKGEYDGKGEYKANDEPLNQEQKRGAYVLAGIVGLGWLIGGPGSSKKDKAHKRGKHDAKAASGGVKGDAEWEKASGAGVVGHGARKD